MSITQDQITTYIQQQNINTPILEYKERDYLGEAIVNIILSDHRKLVVPASVIAVIQVVQVVAEEVEHAATDGLSGQAATVSQVADQLLPNPSPTPQPSATSPRPQRNPSHKGKKQL